MPSKTTKTSQPYEVDGKQFKWTTEDGDVVVIPMRIKLKVIRSISDQELDATAMFTIIEAIAPDQGELLDEMDVNDFTACFQAWQSEYQKLSGATPGE